MELTYFFTDLSYNTAKQTVSIGSLGRDKSSPPIDCGDVPALSAYTAIQVSVSLRNKEDRLYIGGGTLNKAHRGWVQIPLQERPGV